MATDSSSDPAGHEVTERLRQGDGETPDYGDTAVLDEKTRTRSVSSLPARLGRYRITDTLGEGGMGVVYAAIDEQLERPIAVKVLRPESAADQTARERFWREARLAASVNHPHVCQLYEIGESDGHLFIAMERLEGEPLAARLSRGAVPLAESVQIGLEVLDALETLHRRGVTHRDLKPSNVFLTPHGAKVLDFGVSLGRTGDTTRLPLTNPRAILGTPKYMAPEQARGDVATPSADLFAVGAILYEMLSGTAAFEADSVLGILEKVLHGDVPTLAGTPAVAAADRVVHRALSKSSAERYASAAAMAEDLRTALVAEGSEGHHGARPVTRLMVLPFRLLRPDAEIDFLAFSLADAVTNSLSPLESLVVRSTVAAARFASNAPDLRAIANEAKVDVVLSGTLLRAGEALRVSAQLLEAPSGTVLWSHSAQVPLGDIFQLQNTLARQIVESLALPLSGRERRAFGHDVPSNAKAYEFYLRANPLSHESGSWEVARDLYLQSVEADPRYAPAWARLGRVYHLIGKYRGASEERTSRRFWNSLDTTTNRPTRRL
jgi:serine/threonine protein kinase